MRHVNLFPFLPQGINNIVKGMNCFHLLIDPQNINLNKTDKYYISSKSIIFFSLSQQAFRES